MEQIPGVPEVAEFVDDELSSLGEEADGKPSEFFGFEPICVVSGGPSGLESPRTGEGEYSNELTDASGLRVSSKWKPRDLRFCKSVSIYHLLE